MTGEVLSTGTQTPLQSILYPEDPHCSCPCSNTR